MLKLGRFFMLTLFFAAAFSWALAQEDTLAEPDNFVIEPRSIVVNPNVTESAYGVEVYVDRDTSGNDTPVYNVGDNVRISVRPTADSYIYLFSIHSDGTVDQIFPNRLDGQDNYVRANELRTFPRNDAGYNFTISEPLGLDKVFAVASHTELNTNDLASFGGGGQFASSDIGEQSFAQTLSIIVEPLPKNDWVTDTALFYVSQPNTAPPAPTYGTVDVRTNPAGAAVYLDNEFRGYTPVQFGEYVGQHTLQIAYEGYQTTQQTINVVGGQTVTIQPNLARADRRGIVSFETNPSEVSVYVDNQEIGATPTGGVYFEPGTYTARFVRNGYQEAMQTFTVASGGTQVVNATLAILPQEGSLTIRTSAPNARVFINGRDYGSIPGARAEVPDLPVGNHELTVVTDGYSTVVQAFTIVGGRSTEVAVNQRAR